MPNISESKTIRVQRYGAYGIIQRDAKLLLVLTKSGPYKGLWGLPGGGIEFGELPEEALKRELAEEVALAPGQMEFQGIVSSFGKYEKNGQDHDYHFVGILYKVTDCVDRPDLTPEEEYRWQAIVDINQDELTVFAKEVVEQILQSDDPR